MAALASCLHNQQRDNESQSATGTTQQKAVPGQVISIHSGDKPTLAFGRVIEAYAISDRQLAKWLGVSKTTARKVRLGVLPITNERLSKLPRSIFDAYLKALSGPIQLTLF